jgi:hypothetical protein
MQAMLSDSPALRELLVIEFNPNHDVDGHTVLCGCPRAMAGLSALP